MKRALKVKRILWYTGIAAILLLVAFVMYSLRSTAEKSDYTTTSSGLGGMKALYLLTGEMGFEPARYQKSARFLPQKSVLVAVYPKDELINDKLEIKYLQEWVKAGNALLILSDRDTFINYDIARGMKSAPFGDISRETLIAGKLDKGWILLFDGGVELNNENLNGVTAAVEFLKILQQTGFSKVYFNEYYHGLSDNNPLLLDIIGPTGRLILLQLLMALVGSVLVLWRRFGKPIEVFEILKRKENENLTAISNLYIRSRSEDIVLETYLDHFRLRLTRYLGLEPDSEDALIASAAAADRMLKNKNVGSLLSDCNRFIKEAQQDQRGNKNVKRMLYLAGSIEELRREIQ